MTEPILRDQPPDVHLENVLFSVFFGADPRQWTRDDVNTWLRVHHQQLAVDVCRFAMNGRALCVMTPDMFQYRVGRRQGAVLFCDFRRRLLSAVVAQSSSR